MNAALDGFYRPSSVFVIPDKSPVPPLRLQSGSRRASFRFSRRSHRLGGSWILRATHHSSRRSSSLPGTPGRLLPSEPSGSWRGAAPRPSPPRKEGHSPRIERRERIHFSSPGLPVDRRPLQRTNRSGGGRRQGSVVGSPFGISLGLPSGRFRFQRLPLLVGGVVSSNLSPPPFLVGGRFKVPPAKRKTWRALKEQPEMFFGLQVRGGVGRKSSFVLGAPRKFSIWPEVSERSPGARLAPTHDGRPAEHGTKPSAPSTIDFGRDPPVHASPRISPSEGSVGLTPE